MDLLKIHRYELLFDEKIEKENDKTEQKEEDDDEDVHDEEESPEIVHVVILQKRQDTMHEPKQLFGSPFILSVRYDITYQELYKTVVLRLSGGNVEGSGGYLQEVPSLDLLSEGIVILHHCSNSLLR